MVAVVAESRPNLGFTSGLVLLGTSLAKKEEEKLTKLLTHDLLIKTKSGFCASMHGLNNVYEFRTYTCFDMYF